MMAGKHKRADVQAQDDKTLEFKLRLFIRNGHLKAGTFMRSFRALHIFLLGSFFLVGLLGPFSPAYSQTRKVDLELILAVDISGSIDEEEAKLQRKGYIDALTSPEVISAIRSGYHKRIAVSYFEWARYDLQFVIVPWRVIHDLESARIFSSALAAGSPGSGRRTSIAGAIEYAIPMFQKNDFEGPRQVIDISGDGPNNSGPLVTIARDKAIRAGLTINGLPIINDRPSRWGRPPMPNLDLYYRNCVIGGPRAFIVVAEDFKSFARAIRKKLVMEIVGITPKNDENAVSALSKIRSVFPLVRRTSPPCDEGERLRDSWSPEDF